LISENHTQKIGNIELYADLADYYHFNMTGSIKVHTIRNAQYIYDYNRESIDAFNQLLVNIEKKANAKGYKTRVNKITLAKIEELAERLDMFPKDDYSLIYGDIWIDNPASPDNGMGI
jgi:hypothetical protein